MGFKLELATCMEMQVAAGKMTIPTEKQISEYFHTNMVLVLITLVWGFIVLSQLGTLSTTDKNE